MKLLPIMALTLTAWSIGTLNSVFSKCPTQGVNFREHANNSNWPATSSG
jgi:hypothetical protein